MTRKQASGISAEWRDKILEEPGVGFFEELAKERWEDIVRKFDVNTLDQLKA